MANRFDDGTLRHKPGDSEAVEIPLQNQTCLMLSLFVMRRPRNIYGARSSVDRRTSLFHLAT